MSVLMRPGRLISALVLVGVVFLFSGCATQVGPRYIHQITSSQDNVTMLYQQQVGGESERGLIECDRAADGALENCRNINIHFNE